jgi:hypothetical protein
MMSRQEITAGERSHAAEFATESGTRSARADHARARARRGAGGVAGVARGGGIGSVNPHEILL